MSVEKYHLVKESGNFTIIPNKVLQGLPNYDALGLYSYLCSLPTGWEFHKKQLAEHGNIGREKLDKLLKILRNHNLVEFKQIRNQSGQFNRFELHVKNGESFKIIELESNKQPFTEKPLTANRLPVSSTYKRNIDKEIIKTKKREPARKKRVPLSDDFIFEERIIQFAHTVSLKVGRSVSELEAKFRLLGKDRGRLSEDWNAAFEKFLIDERIPKINDTHFSKPTMTSTVKFWEPGNPDYDAHHGLN